MAPHEELLQKIGIVRSRWKAFLWLRGLAWVLGVTVVSLLIGLALANSTSISGWMVTALRLGILAAAIELKVTPGEQTVAKGDNLTIQAVAVGFDPQRAIVHLRYSNGTEWETTTMEVTPQNQPTFRHLVFNIQEPVHYFVDAAGYRS